MDKPGNMQRQLYLYAGRCGAFFSNLLAQEQIY